MRNRLAFGAKAASVICLLASVALLVAALPLDRLTDALRIWVESLGWWGPLAFAAVYALAATCFIPGSALSVAAGLLFGVWLGTATVWLGATLAIALSFLIARYLARARVEEFAKNRPRFAAVDRAVGAQGWRIVALMRLSPVFPFSLQNYLFGVTAIRFWPCWIASATFIVPGTFLYVYLGFAGGEAATAVGGADRAASLRLGLQLAGLLATLVVTLLIARTAAHAIAKEAPQPAPPPQRPAVAAGPAHSSAKAVWTLAIALACLGGSLMAFWHRQDLRSLLPAPRAELAEPPVFSRGACNATPSRDWPFAGPASFSVRCGGPPRPAGTGKTTLAPDPSPSARHAFGYERPRQLLRETVARQAVPTPRSAALFVRHPRASLSLGARPAPGNGFQLRLHQAGT